MIKRYIKILSLMTIVIIAILLFSNLLDLVKNTNVKGVSYFVLLQISFFKVPSLILDLLPIIVMLSTIILIFNLYKTNELSALWVSGVSIYQFIIPIIITNLIIGIVSITILNPFTTYMTLKHDKLHTKFIDKKMPFLTLSNFGIMLSERYEEEYRIYLIQSVLVKDNTLKDVSIFLTDENNNYKQRINAKTGYLKEKQLLLTEVDTFSTNNSREHSPAKIIDTKLSISDLVKRVTAPNNINFWQLPQIIHKLSITGFPILKHQLYYFKLLFKPLIIISYIFLALIFIPKNLRTKNIMQHATISICIAVIIYILMMIFSNFLAYNGINLFVSTLAPNIAIVIISNFIIFYMRKD